MQLKITYSFMERDGRAEAFARPGRCWGNVESEYLRLKKEGRMWFGVKGDARPRIKTYLDKSDGVSAWTWWTNREVGDNQESKKEVIRILGADNSFDYPKPLRLLERIIAIAVDKDSLILDSFAGSGTTGHANGQCQRWRHTSFHPRRRRGLCR